MQISTCIYANFAYTVCKSVHMDHVNGNHLEICEHEYFVGSAQQVCNYHCLQKSLFLHILMYLVSIHILLKLHIGVLKLTTKINTCLTVVSGNHGYAQRKSIVS